MHSGSQLDFLIDPLAFSRSFLNLYLVGALTGTCRGQRAAGQEKVNGLVKFFPIVSSVQFLTVKKHILLS